jgi:UDP-N-acetylmuramoylalanine--D-glutamate ligase
MMAGNENQQVCANLIMGAGSTGKSFLHYLESRGLCARIYDDKMSDEKQSELKAIASSVEVYGMNSESLDLFNGVKRMLISPGINLNHELIKKAKEKQLEIIGDIELFVQQETRPIIAITGSNAKSTVVTLVGLMAEADGRQVGVGGNIGTPVLEFLDDDACELFVVELSSFQLDLTRSLQAKVACILNITPDHMDRYDSFESYVLSKQTIYNNCESVVFNRKDVLTFPSNAHKENVLSFGLDEPDENEFGVKQVSGNRHLYFHEQQIMPVDALYSHANHSLENALAALAIGYSAGFDFAAMVSVLQTFKGLPHRCELVDRKNGVMWINDSKGTNVGATIAAIQSFAEGKNIILLAGGDSKGADLSLLDSALNTHVKHLL